MPTGKPSRPTRPSAARPKRTAPVSRETLRSNGARRQPQQRRSSEKVERILEATELLLEKKRPDEITVKLITERAAVAAPTFYGYFKDRDAVIRTLEMRYIAQAQDVFAAILAGPGFASWREAVRAVFEAYVEWFRTHAAFRLLWYSGRLEDDVYAADRRGNAELALHFRGLLERNGRAAAVPDLVYSFAVDLIEKLLAYGFEEQPDGDPDRLEQGLLAVTAYLGTYLD